MRICLVFVFYLQFGQAADAYDRRDRHFCQNFFFQFGGKTMNNICRFCFRRVISFEKYHFVVSLFFN